MGKSSAAYARTAKLEDTTMGWRFVNRTFEADYGVDSMPVTAENVADRSGVSRIDQDAFALRSQHRADHAIKSEIGRASCRERVRQYVKISVFAVSLKKKKNNRTSNI